MLTLKDIAQAVSGELSGPENNSEIKRVTSDSKYAKGAIFVAITGTKNDGHSYIEKAIECGAIGIIASKPVTAKSVPVILVKDTRAALSRCADLLSDSPSQSMFVVGITGTNGKTTTNWIVQHALNALGIPCLRIGTLGVGLPDGKAESGYLTTPDPVSLHETLKFGYEQGAKASVLEVSSHSLSQSRVDDVAFDVGVFTNLTHDHLDYHGSMEEYFRAKSKLFSLLVNSKKKATACINIDDQYGRKLLATYEDKVNCLSFGESEDATLKICEATLSLEGASFWISWKGARFSIKSSLLGTYNISNLTAAFGACVAVGANPSLVAYALSTTPDVPGRLERVTNDSLTAFVDYAHTPDALLRALQALKPFTKGNLWVVFGCGGDRDRTKRPEMATVAAKIADKIVVTSDNPRSESPEHIIKEILSSGIKPEIIEVDRRKAIRRVIATAMPGDVILVAGKGHEDYQILGSERIHFSDREEISNALKTV